MSLNSSFVMSWSVFFIEFPLRSPLFSQGIPMFGEHLRRGLSQLQPLAMVVYKGDRESTTHLFKFRMLVLSPQPHQQWLRPYGIEQGPHSQYLEHYFWDQVLSFLLSAIYASKMDRLVGSFKLSSRSRNACMHAHWFSSQIWIPEQARPKAPKKAQPSSLISFRTFVALKICI